MIQFTAIVRNADESWSFTWASQGSITYRVVLWGIELAKTLSTSYTWNGQGYQGEFPPPLEIAVGDEVVLSEQFKPYLVMQWYGEVCSYYQIQQLGSVGWTNIGQVEEEGLQVYTFRTTILADETIYHYRVMAVDSFGNQSTPTNYTIYVVCPPLPPNDTVSIDYSVGSITVSQA